MLKKLSERMRHWMRQSSTATHPREFDDMVVELAEKVEDIVEGGEATHCEETGLEKWCRLYLKCYGEEPPNHFVLERIEACVKASVEETMGRGPLDPAPAHVIWASTVRKLKKDYPHGTWPSLEKQAIVKLYDELMETRKRNRGLEAQIALMHLTNNRAIEKVIETLRTTLHVW